MTTELRHIANIRFGYYTQPDQSGKVSYLQVQQFDDRGILAAGPSEYVKLDHKSEPHLLKDGDVLFVGKGSRLFAWRYRRELGPAIASSIFFVLEPDKVKVHPGYLTAVLNAPQSKTAFQQLGSGTNILSIRKSELGAFQLPILHMNQQKKIAELAELHQQELNIAQELIDQKKILYSSLMTKLLK